MGSHGNSMSRQFLITTRLGGGLDKIDTKFYEYSMSFYPGFIRFPWKNVTWISEFWTSSSHGISMAFPKKMMGFPSDLVSFLNQTKQPSKRLDKIPVTFFTGKFMNLFLLISCTVLYCVTS